MRSEGKKIEKTRKSDLEKTERKKKLRGSKKERRKWRGSKEERRK